MKLKKRITTYREIDEYEGCIYFVNKRRGFFRLNDSFNYKIFFADTFCKTIYNAPKDAIFTASVKNTVRSTDGSPNDATKAPQTQIKRVLDASTVKIFVNTLFNDTPRLLPLEIEEEILSHSEIAFRYWANTYKKQLFSNSHKNK